MSTGQISRRQGQITLKLRNNCRLLCLPLADLSNTCDYLPIIDTPPSIATPLEMFLKLTLYQIPIRLFIIFTVNPPSEGHSRFELIFHYLVTPSFSLLFVNISMHKMSSYVNLCSRLSPLSGAELCHASFYDGLPIVELGYLRLMSPTREDISSGFPRFSLYFELADERNIRTLVSDMKFAVVFLATLCYHVTAAPQVIDRSANLVANPDPYKCVYPQPPCEPGRYCINCKCTMRSC